MERNVALERNTGCCVQLSGYLFTMEFICCSSSLISTTAIHSRGRCTSLLDTIDVHYHGNMCSVVAFPRCWGFLKSTSGSDAVPSLGLHLWQFEISSTPDILFQLNEYRSLERTTNSVQANTPIAMRGREDIPGCKKGSRQQEAANPTVSGAGPNVHFIGFTKPR